jgi:phosphoserine phosphatase RsbU/P
MKNFSIKWKLTISFVLLGVMLIGAYVYMATETFESDKISYIFDTEQAQIENLSKQIDQRIDRVVFDSRSVMSGFDFRSKKLNSIAQNLFTDQKDILAIKVMDITQAENLLSLDKDNVKIPEEFKSAIKGKASSGTEVTGLTDGQFVVVSSEKAVDGSILIIKILAKFDALLPKSANAQFLFSQNDNILNEIKNPELKETALEIIRDLNVDRASKTMLKEVNGKKFLVSSIALNYTNLRLTSMLDEKTALGALSVLYNRSLIFVLFSVFATLIISLLLSSGLTQSLQKLTGVAEKISQGDFSSEVTSTSKDEVGTLSRAFAKMNQEIVRLLDETKDKVRMESELKTAKLVQESLFPKKPHFKSGDIEISGLFVTSTECGGDWWYYFERGENFYVVIADATGHGTPAALITCAARALFIQFERSDISLEQMVASWDSCIAECSSQKVMMTGLIMEINKKTGKVRTVNASHEYPVLVSSDVDDQFIGEPLILPIGPSLGELKNLPWEVHEFQLKAKDKLVIYTDGLLAITNPAGKELGEKRMIKTLNKLSQTSESALDLTDKLYAVFEDHRSNTSLPDDVTLVVLEWKSSQSSSEKISVAS